MIGKWYKRLASSTKIDWPELPEDGFLSGRSAKVGDVDRGYAIFSQRGSDGSSAEPYPITVPQYAFWRNEAGIETPVIVVQAERHLTDEGEVVFGLRQFDGVAIVALGNEVRLLGAAIPCQ